MGEKKPTSFLIQDILRPGPLLPRPAPVPPPPPASEQSEVAQVNSDCSDARSCRRRRTAFSLAQLTTLEQTFAARMYISSVERALLARSNIPVYLHM